MKIKLEKLVIPELKEVKVANGNYYMTNNQNNFYENLQYLYDNSSIHKAILDNLRDKVVGSNVNSDKKTKQLIKNITQDLTLYGGFTVEIIWNILHTKINKINYIDFSKIRSGMVDQDTDEVQLYFYSNDWKGYHKNVQILQSFNTDENSDSRQIYYYKDYAPGFNVYPKPSYYASIRWVYTDVELCRYYSNLVKNNFVSNVIISMKNGFDDPDKQENFEKSIKDNFTGSENAGSIPVIYGVGDGDDPIKIVKFNDGSDDNKYQWLSQHTIDQLIIGHRIPNPLLCGVRIPGSLGGSTELEESENIYNKNVVYPTRDNILSFLNDINPYMTVPVPTEITDISVVNQKNTTTT